MDTELVTYGLGNSELFISITYLVLSFSQAYLSNYNLCFREVAIPYFTLQNKYVIFLLILEQLYNVRPNLKDITEILVKILFVLLAALIGYFLISKLTSIIILVNNLII